MTMLSHALDTARRLWAIGFKNPIVSRELVRSLRQGRYFVMLVVVLGVGALVISLLWEMQSSGTEPVGRFLFYATIGGQLVVILLLLPGYVAQALISERDRNTFPILMTTPLGAGRIVLGKLFSTLGVMLVLLIATYPLIGVCMARGGVSPVEVLLSIAGLLFACFSVASFAIFHSLHATTPLRAILMTQFTVLIAYLVGGALFSFVGGIILSLASIFAALTNMALRDYALVFAVIGALVGLPILALIPLGMLYQAAKRLRYLEPRIRQPWEQSMLQVQLSQTPAHAQGGQKRRSIDWDWAVRDNENPFYWRERKGQTATVSPFAVPNWYIIGIIAYHLVILAPLQSGGILAMLSLLFLGQMAPAHAAPLFAGERENQSWDLLLATISKARTLVDGKLLGGLVPCAKRWGVLTYVPVLVIYLFTGAAYWLAGVHFPSVPLANLALYSLVLLLHLVFITLLAAYCSARLDQVNRAMVTAYSVVAMLFFSPFVLEPIAAIWLSPWVGDLIASTSPLLLLYALSFDGQFWLTGWVVHIALYGAASIAFYLLTLRHIARQR